MSLKTPEFSNVIDLSEISRELELPSSFVATLAQSACAEVISVRLGCVTAEISPDMGVEIRISLVNIYNRSIKAYEMFGWAVPRRLYELAERWELEHGRRK